MPRLLLHVLVWSEEAQLYELRSHGEPEQWFTQADEPAFARWLAEHTAFAFVGRAGRLSVRKEGRGNGKGYWYAYRKQEQRIRKGYLGPSARVTFARLEEQARSLTRLPALPAPARDLARPLSGLSIPLLATRLTPPRLPLWLVARPPAARPGGRLHLPAHARLCLCRKREDYLALGMGGGLKAANQRSVSTPYPTGGCLALPGGTGQRSRPLLGIMHCIFAVLPACAWRGGACPAACTRGSPDLNHPGGFAQRD